MWELYNIQFPKNKTGRWRGLVGRPSCSIIVYGEQLETFCFSKYSSIRDGLWGTDIYHLRFGKKVRVLGALILVLGGILNMGLFLKVGAIFIQTIFGLDPNGQVLIFIMLGLLVLVLVYTISGGMISVIITDYIQYIILSISFLIAVF